MAAINRVNTFDDWIDYFKEWRETIGIDPKYFDDYPFETKLEDIPSDEIEFGDFAGQRKWETAMEIPDQRIRDGVLNMIVYQGDTEFASVEQQRSLFDKAPSEYDLQCLVRVMAEEMRHGWQMCYLLVKYFGQTGKIEAQKQLERRSWKHNRLLGSFNEDVDNWLDFFTYTNFVDRDGKFQLKMLSKSSFAPLARSVTAMLKEEAFHMSTGNNGLTRIVKQGKVPTKFIQKYFNKWIPTAYDLFGKDSSSTANWSYVWGVKGRFDEGETTDPVDKQALNERSRQQFRDEVAGLIERMNKHIPDSETKLYTPHMKFNRSIGDYADQCYTVTGEPVPEDKYEDYKKEVLPTAEDKKELETILAGDGWIEPRN
ncbi:MAG: phenylacetate-CoA oxygenase subunit PaaI [Planctomycetes bacterium]|nr:phenylacetate-CoA oxygenase subunit PaaI [Planctomycetota bacterium]